MTHHPELYPPRERRRNVTLIKNILNAGSQHSLTQALMQFSESLHPSLFAELDWMEMTVPPAERERAIELVDSLFLDNLEAIVSQRAPEYEVSELDLLDEICENRDFYELIVVRCPDIASSLGSSLSAKVRHVFELTAGVPRPRNASRYEPLKQRILARLAAAKHRDSFPLIIKEVVSNEIAVALDHISSRMRAKGFIRSLGGQLPQFYVGEIRSQQDVDALVGQVQVVQSAALEYQLPSLQECATTILVYLKERDILALNQYEGERATGYGHCGICSMMYSSSALVALNPSSPAVLPSGSKGLHLPLGFNSTTCPFCRTRMRINAPAMFHWPDRRKVIYCVPTLGELSESEAEDVHRGTIQQIRQRYKNSLSAEEAALFDGVAEEVTYDMLQFILAIQTGTTNKVWHCFGIIKLADGSACIVDPTNHIIIELICPSELHQLWNTSPHAEPVLQQEQNGNADALLGRAVEAFVDGDPEATCKMLECEHKQHPEDATTARCLASVYLRMGKKHLAARVLESIGW